MFTVHDRGVILPFLSISVTVQYWYIYNSTNGQLFYSTLEISKRMFFNISKLFFIIYLGRCFSQYVHSKQIERPKFNFTPFDHN